MSKSSNDGLESGSVFIGLTHTSYKDENGFCEILQHKYLLNG